MFRAVFRLETLAEESYMFGTPAELVRFLKWVHRRQKTKRRALDIIAIVSINEVTR